MQTVEQLTILVDPGLCCLMNLLRELLLYDFHSLCGTLTTFGLSVGEVRTIEGWTNWEATESIIIRG